MAINVREVERDQLWLMPPSVRDSLPEDHLAGFVLDVVAELDLAEFYAAHRPDGRGGAVYEQRSCLACSSTRTASASARRAALERRLVKDVALRVVAANQRPDYATLGPHARLREAAASPRRKSQGQGAPGQCE